MSLYVKIPLVYFERDIIMSQWDKDYLGLCRKILEEGTEVVNRTGTNTIKVPSHHFHFDLSQEFPILTTKQLFIRQAVLEMMWIYQAQSNDVRWLQERDVKIWNEWEIDEKGYWNATQMLPDENGNLVPYHLGHFFIAIDTGHFIGEDETRKKAGEIIRSVRNSQKAPGCDRIYTAGEKEWDIWQQRKNSGVPINESVQKEMTEVRDELGLTQYKFPWE